MDTVRQARVQQIARPLLVRVSKGQWSDDHDLPWQEIQAVRSPVSKTHPQTFRGGQREISRFPLGDRALHKYTFDTARGRRARSDASNPPQRPSHPTPSAAARVPPFLFPEENRHEAKQQKRTATIGGTGPGAQSVDRTAAQSHCRGNETTTATY